MKVRAVGAVAAMLLGATMFAGCMATPTTGSGDAAAGGGDVRLALAAEPSNTDPIMTRSIAAWNMYYALYDGLTRIAADGAIEPGLAESWEHNDDLTVWDFTIREGVEFHNGDPLTAGDVVYTYSTILASDTSTNRPAIAMVEKVEELDGGIVRFTLKNPFSAWINQVATIGIVPEDVYAAEQEQFVEHPVGTGPFSFVSWNHGVDYTVERNDEYWGTPAEAETVTFAFVGAEDARVTGVESATLDAAVIPPNQVPVLEGSTRASVIESPSNQVVFLGINTTAGVLADERIRQAISLAVDRDAIISTLLGGLGTLNGQLVAEGVTGYVPDFATPDYDVKAAEALLAEAGYAGEEIPLEYTTVGGLPMSAEVAQAISGYLGAVGLNVKLVGAEQASQSLSIANHEIAGLYLSYWSPSSMDGDVVVNQLLAGGPEDYARDPEMAALYLEQQAAPEAERAQVFEEIWTANAERVYHVPLYTSSFTYAVNPSLEWTPAVDGIFRASEVALGR
ncbi:MAG: ABC transporter substrate-binding protein [Agromyces sp.]